MNLFEVVAESRADVGKGASRRLRRQGKVPAILYGSGKEPVQMTINHHHLAHHLEKEAFYSHILTLKIGDQVESAVLKALQRHPSRPIIMHVDFQRVSETSKLHMHVPLHFLNQEQCVGVRTSGGVISHQMSEVEVYCLPKDLPEYIEVDMAEIKLGQVIHLSDLKLPAGVEVAALKHGAEHDLPVVNVHLPRGATVEEAAAETEPSAVPAAKQPAKPAPAKGGK
jgi:large subunit ribosomal protein L25